MTVLDTAAAQALAAAIRNPPCADLGWDAIEKAHAAARSRSAATAAAEPALRACRRCPFLAECSEWARRDQYTGLAAGQAWHNGRRREPGRVVAGPIDASNCGPHPRRRQLLMDTPA